MSRFLFAAAILCSALCAQTPVQPFLQPRQAFVDSVGSPCAGCSVYTYAAGTTTPLATFVDYTGTAQNTNPIILDTSGSTQLWGIASLYKFILKDTLGRTVWTVDHIPTGASTGGGGGGSSIPNFIVNFTNQLSVTIPASASGITTLGVIGSCYDSASPANQINWQNLSVSGALAVTISFALPQSGYCVINNSGANGSELTGTVLLAPPGAQSIVQPSGTTLNVNDMDVSVLNGFQTPELLNTAHADLAFWGAILHNCQNQVVHVQIHGDSRSIIDTTVTPGAGTTLSVTFGTKWADQLETMLAAQCGNHGGVKPFRWGTGNFVTQGFNEDWYSATGSYTAADTAIGPYQPNTMDAMNITAVTNGATITLIAPPFDHIGMYCAQGPGLNPWTMTIDGNTVGTCGGAAGSLQALRVQSSAVAWGPHTAAVSCPTQPCEGYAAEWISGVTGIAVDNLSIGGASAEAFGFAPTTQYAYSDLIPSQPALDIIYQISNEPGQGYTPAQFQTTLNNMITHDRTAFGFQPSIMIFSPLQDAITGQTPYYPILAATAAAQSTAFADIRDRWGTALAPSYLFGPDDIHESNQGNGEVYSMISQTLLDVQPKPWQTVYTNPVTNVSGFQFINRGHNVFSCLGEGTGNGNQTGVVGCFDATLQKYLWNTNTGGDFFIGPPFSGNPSIGTGFKFKVSGSTAEVDTTNNVLDDGSGNSAVAGTFRANAGLQAGTSGALITNSNLLPQVGTPTVNHAACIKAAGPPVIIGYCSTVVSSTGTCTCL